MINYTTHNTHIYIHAGYILTQWIKTSEGFFNKIYLSLYCKVCVWEGVGDRTELQYIDPHSYSHQRCVFLALLMLNWRPRGSAFCWLSLPLLITNWSGPQTPSGSLGPLLLGGGFPYHNLSPTRLISNSLGGPEGPFCWMVALLTTSPLQLLLSPTHWLPVFTKLYNS